MAQQSRDWRRSDQSRDEQSRYQGRRQARGYGSEYDMDYGEQGGNYSRGAQDIDNGRSYSSGREERSFRGSRGFSGASRGQSWGDRDLMSRSEYERFGGREFGGGYFGTSGSYGSLGQSGGYYGGSSGLGERGSQGAFGSRSQGEFEDSGGYGSGGQSVGYASNRGQQQSYRGRGPKGYQRSDERIKEAVCELLSDEPTIDASEISVAVSNGVVTLTGSVDDRGTKYQVEEIVSECGGVKDVENQLRVQSQSGQTRPGQSASGQSSSQFPSQSSGSRSGSYGTSTDGGPGRSGTSSH